MFIRFRRWLAFKIIGRDPRMQFFTHAEGLARFMIQQEIRSLRFMTSVGYWFALGRVGEPGCNLRCSICTHYFAGAPDRPAKCPSCGSTDVTLAEQDVF